MSVAIIVLAAGGSSRLGHPKQLLRYRESTLLRHAAQTALATQLGPVIVVLGSEETRCRETLLGLPVTMTVNSAWQEGMGESIAAGMRAVEDEASHQGVMIMLCDQPAITPEILLSLEAHQRNTGASIVASSYGDTLGPPALFMAPHFPELRRLHGAHGAKTLIQSGEGVSSVPCPEAAFDIDTEEDLALLQRDPGELFPR